MTKYESDNIKRLRLLADKHYHILKKPTYIENEISKNRAIYETIFCFEKEPEPFERTRETLSKCNPVFNRLMIDIDAEDLETAYKDANTINGLLIDAGFKTNVFFSGGKGFHIDIRFKPIDYDIMKYYPAFLEYWHNKESSVDTKLKDGIPRLIRLPYAKHDGTGLFKIPVNLNDDLKTIKKQAEHRPKKEIKYVLTDSSIVEKHLTECFEAFGQIETQKTTIEESSHIPIVEDLRVLDEEQISEVVELVSPIFPILHRTREKHDGARHLGGYFSYHIDKSSANKICDGIIKKVGNLFDNSNDFKHTVLKNYSKADNKTGLRTLTKTIEKITDGFDVEDFKYQLNRICVGLIPLTSNYVQFENHNYRKDGLYQVSRKRDEDGNIKKQYHFKGNILIKSLKITHDTTSYEGKRLFAPVVSIKYKDTAINVEKEIIRETYSTVVKRIQEEQMLKTDDKGIRALLRDLYIDGVNQKGGIVTAETDLLKDGFFYDENTNKIVSNNVFTNFNSTADDVREAVTLFNEILSTRGTAIQNDCTLFRFMLWSPFGASIKQLGFTDGLYSMVLWGVTDTNKTGSSVMYSYLYADKRTTLQKANTQSAIGSRLGENTFPLIIDEAKDNLIDPNNEEFNKNIVTDIIGRSVKDKTDNTSMLDFPALRMTVRTLNQDLREQYTGEFYKRHKVLYYDQSMQIKEADKIAFNKQYKPNSPNTLFTKFKHIGKAFADRFIPYLETQSEELYDLEKLTIKVLKQIEDDYNIQFHLSVMLPQDLSNPNDDEGSIIRNGLTKLFNKKHRFETGKSTYTEHDFQHSAKNGEITWLDYKPTKKVFAIKVSEFETEVSNIIRHHIPALEILKLVGIKDAEIIPKGKFKSSVVKIIELRPFDLTYKLFGITVYDADELEAYLNKSDEDKLIEMQTQYNKLDKEIKRLKKEIALKESKKKQREAEAERLLNAKPIKKH